MKSLKSMNENIDNYLYDEENYLTQENDLRDDFFAGHDDEIDVTDDVLTIYRYLY